MRPVALLPPLCQQKLAAQLEADYSDAANRGEFLMKKYLDMRVRLDCFIDNSRPGFLISPLTDEALELDRHYCRHNVAFEFNGPQHWELTDRYPGEQELRETKARDAIKRGLCQARGITLITITAEQLHPDILETLIPPHLPRRPLDKQGSYYRKLVELCTRYIRAAKAASADRKETRK